MRGCLNYAGPSVFVRHPPGAKPSTLRAVPSPQRTTTPFGKRGSLAERPLWRLLEDAQDMVYRYRLSPTRGTEYVAGAVGAITGHTAAEFYADPDLVTRALHPQDATLLGITQPSPDAVSPVTVRWIHADGRIVFAEHRV